MTPMVQYGCQNAISTANRCMQALSRADCGIVSYDALVMVAVMSGHGSPGSPAIPVATAVHVWPPATGRGHDIDIFLRSQC